MIKVTLKNGEIMEFENGVTAADVCKQISMGLYRAACACEINGEVKDLRTALNDDCTLNILTFDDENGKKAYWHTTSHILAQAIKRLYPDVKLAIGPSIDNGFYYDFDFSAPFTADDIEKVEAEIKKIIKENIPLEKFDFTLLMH